LKVKNDEGGLDYFIPLQDEVAMANLPVQHQQGYIAFAIGAQHATKKLPKEKILELCNNLNYPVVLLGDNKDNEVARFIEEKIKNKISIYNACGKYNLNQSASLLKQAKIVFSHDTGLMHIAAAFKKEIYSIWGNTIPKFGMYPYLTSFHILENKDLDCRPCSKIGFDKCPKGHFKCMKENSLDVNLILNTSLKKNLIKRL
jgi:heptosyltransferase-2